MYRFLVVIERCGETYSAYSPDLPGCVATGETREEVERNIHEAIEMHVQGVASGQLTDSRGGGCCRVHCCQLSRRLSSRSKIVCRRRFGCAVPWQGIVIVELDSSREGATAPEDERAAGSGMAAPRRPEKGGSVPAATEFEGKGANEEAVDSFARLLLRHHDRKSVNL